MFQTIPIDDLALVLHHAGQNLALNHGGNLAPIPPGPLPNCLRCGKPTERFFTSDSNENGNASRPFHKCGPCDKFASFLDGRGVLIGNPPCGCGRPSRRQAAGQDNTRVPGGLHFVCSVGACKYYEPQIGPDGNQLAVTSRAVLAIFVMLNLI